MRALLRSLESSESTRAWGFTVLRVVIGFAFFMHGWQKVFEFGISGVEQGFGQMGVPLASLTAPLVAFLELLGGAALIVGLGTRWFAVPLAIDMLAAMALVHWSGGFFAPNGVELVLLLFAGLVALAFGGPGALALDHFLAKGGWAWSPRTVESRVERSGTSVDAVPRDRGRPAA